MFRLRRITSAEDLCGRTGDGGCQDYICRPWRRCVSPQAKLTYQGLHRSPAYGSVIQLSSRPRGRGPIRRLSPESEPHLYLHHISVSSWSFSLIHVIVSITFFLLLLFPKASKKFVFVFFFFLCVCVFGQSFVDIQHLKFVVVGLNETVQFSRSASL